MVRTGSIPVSATNKWAGSLKWTKRSKKDAVVLISNLKYGTVILQMHRNEQDSK